MSAHVLIVEDEPKIAALLRDYFDGAGYRTDTLSRGDLVEAFVAREAPDLVVLDIQLPGKDGLEVCRALRARGTQPAIMMLTARVDELDRLLGLELGADDYVCKPFSPREIVARAKAILRRMEPRQESTGILRLGSLTIDRSRHGAELDGHPIVLTRIEFELLAALVEQPQRIWSRAQLLERVRGASFEGYERNVDGHVKNLRKKLRELLPGGAEAIRSVYGVGYGLEASAFAPAAE